MVVFNIAELISTLVRFVGMPIHNIFLMRAVALVAHYTTLIIQKHNLFQESGKRWLGWIYGGCVNSCIDDTFINSI